MFSWDIRKAIGNFEKHGVPFEEAATGFGDPDGLDWEDLAHSQLELRYKRGRYFSCRQDSAGGVYVKEGWRWKRNDPDYRRTTSEPEGAPNIFQTVRLISRIFQSQRTRNSSGRAGSDGRQAGPPSN